MNQGLCRSLARDSRARGGPWRHGRKAHIQQRYADLTAAPPGTTSSATLIAPDFDTGPGSHVVADDFELLSHLDVALLVVVLRVDVGHWLPPHDHARSWSVIMPTQRRVGGLGVAGFCARRNCPLDVHGFFDMILRRPCPARGCSGCTKGPSHSA